MAAGTKEMRNPASRLSNDLIVEILSRLPIKSLCRSKCVSKHWRDLISHPDHRKKLPQTLAGFFYHTTCRERFPESARHFTNVTGRGEPLIRPSLSFLPGYADIDILDCCNGRLLCRSRTAAGPFRYVICNPATEQWAAVPQSNQSWNICSARLGFDPAVSPHFHVFEFVETGAVDGLEIYSSVTGEWVHSYSRWSDKARLCHDVSTVFLNGFLRMVAFEHQDVLVVDTEGKVRRTIPVPRGYYNGLIGQSRGKLYYLNVVEVYDFKLVVFVLEDYATDHWVFKHSVRMSKLLGTKNSYPTLQHYSLIAVHPECHLIFFISDLDHTIRCYDMDRREVLVICNMGCMREWPKRCLPYVPLFSESSVGWN